MRNLGADVIRVKGNYEASLKECINQLTEMGVITYDEEDGQTDSTEEIQGQKEEE